MAGAEESTKEISKLSTSETLGLKESCPDTTQINNELRQFEHLDSFEKLEAQLLASNSLDEACPPEYAKNKNDFSEDYSIKEGTYLDTRKFSDPRTFDIIRDLETLERLRTLEMENDADLERREVAALIKKAEEKLLPSEKDFEANEVLDECLNPLETAFEPQVIVPQLVELEKPLLPSDLVRMESSDLSEEEGFRLRLSCILEESESDTASMSGSLIKQVHNPPTSPKVLNETKSTSTEFKKPVNDDADGNSVECTVQQISSPLYGDNDTIHGLDVFQETAINLDTPRKHTTDTLEQTPNVPQCSDDAESEQDSELLERLTENVLDEDSIGTPSQSPEPKSFGIQKLKSGSNVNKLLTKPLLIKRLESSSDSSLDLSTTLSSPGAEGEHGNVVELDIQLYGKSRTPPENTTVEIVTSEFLTAESGNRCDITGMTDKEIEALFPKLKRRQRGKSLESGMTEKVSEEKNKKEEEQAKLETKSQKGDEERPPLPPVTYLWEELRRWRMKGGYPWTYLDKPAFDEKTWKYNADHEYEPINPPPIDANLDRPRRQDEDALEERRFLRIPKDEELVLSPEDMEMEAIAAAQDLQDDLEGRFLATTPMTTTTASRTDCDVNTSMLDSSGLEDLPLKRGSRTKKAIQDKTEQMRAQAQGIQQRLRSQAGKLRNKLRSIPRPSFQRKQDREKQRSSPTEAQKPRFQRPRISLPERPKFNFPERPKFKMPQKPKLNLPNFSNPLKERQSNTLQAEPKKKIFDIDFKTYPRMFSKKSRDRGDYATSSPKLQRSATPPPAPIQPARKKGPIGQRWVNRFDDIKFVDDKASEISHRSELSESLSGFHDKDFAITEDMEQTHLPPARTLSTKSSLSHLSDRDEAPSSGSSFDHRRAGVIEEIDSDQFFLRQKGISEEDIDMGKYLSEEIREAFRSPVVNALRQLDYDYEDENTGPDYKYKENDEPMPPTRVKSLKKSKTATKEPETQQVPHYIEESSKLRYENIEEPVSKVKQDTTIIRNGDHEPSRYENIPDNVGNLEARFENIKENIKDNYGTHEDNASEYYKSPPTPVEYQHYKVPRTAPTPAKRKSSATEQGSNKKKHSDWVEVEVETSLVKVEAEPIPLPLQRKKSRKSLGRQETVEVEINKQDYTEPDYIVPDEPTHPDPPRRFRSSSRGARSVHSLAQEDEVSNFQEASAPEAPIRYRSLSRGARSTHSLAQEQQEKDIEVPPPEAPKRYRSLSRGARSIHSLAQEEEEKKPVPPKRTSSKRSLHSLGFGVEPQQQDTRSIHSLAMDYEGVGHYKKRTKSLGRGSRSLHSLSTEHEVQAKPIAPERTRSNSRASRSYQSLADDAHRNSAQDRDQSKTLPRSSETGARSQENIETFEVIKKHHIYESPTDGYAVVDKASTKPKPPRPPPPRRRKGSQSPNFNTFPRRSPMRPVRAYATLGPSRPPRKSKPNPARSIEHIYQSDQISHAYVEAEETLKPTHAEELHGSNKDLQTDEVIEKMKGRPLPAPPRPPRLRSKAEEPSMEEVEEVCVSTQTDPLPDDLVLEDDIMQELSHDEYQRQEAFLQAMREEDDRIQKDIEERRAKQLAADAQRALEKERTAQLQLERARERETREEAERSKNTNSQETSRGDSSRSNRRQPDDLEKSKKTLQLEQEDDMGYASLDRRQTRVEEVPQPSSSSEAPAAEAKQQSGTQETTSSVTPAAPVYIPLVPEVISTESLRVGSLEVDRLQINELLATSLQVQDLRTQSLLSHDLHGTSLHIQDITSQTGQLNIGNIELPPEFIQQIIARIPWEQLRPQQPLFQEQESPVLAEERQFVGVEELPAQQQVASPTRRRHRHFRQHSSRSQYSSDEEETAHHTRRQLRTVNVDPNILDLSRQLARACTSAGFRAMREFSDRLRVPEQEEDRMQYMKTMLCIIFIAIAGYFLIWHHAKDVHHHHWDFQFPPQPPKQ